MEIMNININMEIGFYNLWLIFVGFVSFAWILMKIGTKLRGTKIENPEDHANLKITIISFIPLLALLIISIFTPIIIGTLFWIGLFVLSIVGIVYILSIIAFVKAKKGLTINGIYKFSRNPMYVSLFLIFISFAFMAWQVNPIIGIAILCITILKGIIIHWMILGEENFLKKKYGSEYYNYLKKVSRYLGVSKKL